METIIRGEKIKVTSAMKDYVNEKLEKLDKYFDKNIEVRANVIVKVNNTHEQLIIFKDKIEKIRQDLCLRKLNQAMTLTLQK